MHPFTKSFPYVVLRERRTRIRNLDLRVKEENVENIVDEVIEENNKKANANNGNLRYLLASAA